MAQTFAFLGRSGEVFSVRKNKSPYKFADHTLNYTLKKKKENIKKHHMTPLTSSSVSVTPVAVSLVLFISYLQYRFELYFLVRSSVITICPAKEVI